MSSPFQRVSPLILLVPLLASIASARLPRSQDAAPSRASVVRTLMSAALDRGEAYSMLQELCSEAPHRLAGSPGAARAEAWAKRKLESLGLANVRLEECSVPHWVRGRVARVTVTAPAEAKLTPLPILALGGSVATPEGGLRARVIEIQTWEELEARSAEARGAIVLLNRPMDPSESDPFAAYGKAVDQRSRGAIECAKRGAAAVLVRSMTLRLDDYPHTGAMRYDDAVPKIPAAAISTAGAERLAGLLRSNPTVELTLELDCRTLPDTIGHNVVADLIGHEHPDEIVVVGGHLDAWDIGEGAHDDGAGCVHAIEAVRLIQAHAPRPRRTIRCVLWANEENGLRGARAYRDTRPNELDRHILSLESDRGGFAPRGFGTNANGPAWEELTKITQLLEPWGAHTLKATNGGADTSPLEALGLNVIELLPDSARYFDYHHCGRDTVDQVHPRELALGAGAIASLAWCVANLDHPLPRAAPAPSQR